MAKKLTIVTGPAGAGKSTFARELCRQSGACLLDSDTVTEQVVKAGMRSAGMDPDDRDSSEYRRHFRMPVYEVLFDTAAENLQHTDVVIVGPFTSEIRKVTWPSELEDRFNCQVEVLFITCEEEVRYQRIKTRANTRDRWKLENWESYLMKSSVEVPACLHRVIAT